MELKIELRICVQFSVNTSSLWDACPPPAPLQTLNNDYTLKYLPLIVLTEGRGEGDDRGQNGWMAQRLVWAAKQALGKAALGALFA